MSLDILVKRYSNPSELGVIERARLGMLPELLTVRQVVALLNSKSNHRYFDLINEAVSRGELITRPAFIKGEYDYPEKIPDDYCIPASAMFSCKLIWTVFGQDGKEDQNFILAIYKNDFSSWWNSIGASTESYPLLSSWIGVGFKPESTDTSKYFVSTECESSNINKTYKTAKEFKNSINSLSDRDIKNKTFEVLEKIFINEFDENTIKQGGTKENVNNLLLKACELGYICFDASNEKETYYSYLQTDEEIKQHSIQTKLGIWKSNYFHNKSMA